MRAHKIIALFAAIVFAAMFNTCIMVNMEFCHRIILCGITFICSIYNVNRFIKLMEMKP